MMARGIGRRSKRSRIVGSVPRMRPTALRWMPCAEAIVSIPVVMAETRFPLSARRTDSAMRSAKPFGPKPLLRLLGNPTTEKPPSRVEVGFGQHEGSGEIWSNGGKGDSHGAAKTVADQCGGRQLEA